MKKALVFDGRSRAALSVIRSLGKKGVYIIAGEAFNCASFFSKYTREKLIYPPPDKNPEGFITFILNYLKRNKVDVIIPVRDSIMKIVVNNQEAFSKHASFLVPSPTAFEMCRDKAETIRLARKLDVPHPTTILTGEEDYCLETLKATFQLPVLIKPRISSGSRGISIIRDWADFKAQWEKTHVDYPYPMVQEFIPHGGAYGVSMLYNRGMARASFTHKRVREFPPSGGPSTLREGVHYEEIEQYAARLLDDLQWNGVAMVEYRVDARSGQPKLMEINPRFWGSLQTAVFSGIDFPYLLAQAAHSGDCDSSFSYPAGKQVRWFLFGDLLWFLKSKKNWEVVRSFFQFKRKNLSYDIFSWRDLGPSWGAFIEAFNSFLKSERRKHTFKRGWE